MFERGKKRNFEDCFFYLNNHFLGRNEEIVKSKE